MTALTTVWYQTGKGQSLVGRQLLNLLVSNVTVTLLKTLGVETGLFLTQN